MFKVGDKVVYTGGGRTDSGIIYPVLNKEIVVIKRFYTEEGDSDVAIIEGYEYDIHGGLQGFNFIHIRKVEPNKKRSNAITRELVEELLTEEKKTQIERIEIKEKELV